MLKSKSKAFPLRKCFYRLKSQHWYDWNVCFTVSHACYFGLVFIEGNGLYAISAGGLFLLIAWNYLAKPEEKPKEIAKRDTQAHWG